MARKFSWSSTYDAGSGDVVFYARNDDSDRELSIRNILLGSVANNLFHIYTATGTPRGTAVSGENRSRISLKRTSTGVATTLGDAAVLDVVVEGLITRRRVPANRSEEIVFDEGEFVLGSGDAMIIQVAVSGVFEAVVMGEYA